jgi:hypothetical protein
MPLTFESLDRGAVAFGFFNIDSDMLLLEERFFFADAFCDLVVRAASVRTEPVEIPWTVRVIERREDIGDLMGAIRGERHTGFIGETYRRYPFPEREEDFRQKAEGDRTRTEFLEMITPFAVERRDVFRADPVELEVAFGDVRFDRDGFRALVEYVWRGGWPRWRDEERPGYVLGMKEAVDGAEGPLLGGLELRVR